MTEETATEETTEEKVAAPSFLDLVKDFPNAPSQAIIDEWKAAYGDIFVSGFSEKEVFIWRALNRTEYKRMQVESQVSALVNTEPKDLAEAQTRVHANIDSTFAQEDHLVSQCLLWPKLSPEELSKKAGTVPTLLEQIMLNSNFMSPQQASALVIKL